MTTALTRIPGKWRTAGTRMRIHSVTLPPADAATARELGAGNVSRGLRAALQHVREHRSK